MKLILVLVALLSTTQANPLQRGLIKDVTDFMVLIPFEEIAAVYEKYAQDEQVVSIVEYAFSEDFNEALGDVYTLPQLQDLIAWVLKNLSFIEPRPRNIPMPVIPGFRVNGWDAFLNEVMSLVPMDDIESLAIRKMTEGGAFAELFKLLQDSRDLYEEMIQMPSVVKYLHNLRDLGVDIDALDRTIRDVFGWYKL